MNGIQVLKHILHVHKNYNADNKRNLSVEDRPVPTMIDIFHDSRF